MNRGAWWATVHGVARVVYDLALNHHHHMFRYISSAESLEQFYKGVCKDLEWLSAKIYRVRFSWHYSMTKELNAVVKYLRLW